jgi:hypothetical protein
MRVQPADKGLDFHRLRGPVSQFRRRPSFVERRCRPMHTHGCYSAASACPHVRYTHSTHCQSPPLPRSAPAGNVARPRLPSCGELSRPAQPRFRVRKGFRIEGFRSCFGPFRSGPGTPRSGASFQGGNAQPSSQAYPPGERHLGRATWPLHQPELGRSSSRGPWTSTEGPG